MTAFDAERKTGLVAREVFHPETMKRDNYLSALGDLFRCQLGRVVTTYVEMTGKTGKTYKVPVTVFHLAAYGESFETAIQKLRKN